MFKKEGFDYYGGYLTYKGDFVARFKYVKFQGSFKNFLIKHFTPEEYFTRYKEGESPLAILESKGFMTPMAKKLCKQNFMKPTQENYKICIHAIAEARMSA